MSKRPLEADDAAAPPKEEDFPRGGGGALTALERRQAREEGRNRAERELGEGSRPSKKRKGSSIVEDGEDTFFAREALQGRLPKYVELLKFKALSVGAKVWGSVAEIHPKELIVSLPHGLRGRVQLREVSDVVAEKLSASQKTEVAGKPSKAAAMPLQDLFAVGQLVRCSVVALHDKDSSDAPHKGKRAIELSLHVAKVNDGIGAGSLTAGLQLAACVRSIEDHGFLLSIGIQGMSAFLERTNWVKACGGHNRPLLPGALLEVVVTAAPKQGKRMVHVSVDPKVKAKAVVKEWEGLTIGSLLPGMLVNVKVRNVLSDGLLVSFLTFFNGTIDCFHLTQELMQADWQKSFEAGQRLQARILYVDAGSKRVCLTLLPHLVAGQSAPSLPKGNALFQACHFFPPGS
ncbi:g7636 [Coccomyxa viridis]|uniref:G7636 protein n=1 Tax=Coccomyxa viridis TaxID=1274662 RepID=A0ABP1G4Z4_9CHLO